MERQGDRAKLKRILINVINYRAGMDERELREKIEQVVIFITDKFEKAGKLTKPALCHSLRVGFYLYGKSYSSETILAGFLHDTIEDTATSKDEIGNLFGEKIANLVDANSKKIQNDERTRDMIERCIKLGEDALIVKAADILENMTYSVKQDWDKGLEHCPRAARIVFDKKPDNFRDPIFLDLKEKCLENKNG